MKKFTLSLLSTALLLGCSYHSFAEADLRTEGKGPEMSLPMPHGHEMIPPMPGTGPLLWRALLDLNLDEEQQKAVEELRIKTVKEMVKKRAEEQLAGIELGELLEKDPVDMKAVEAKVREMERIRADLHIVSLRERAEVGSRLSTAQRKMLRDLLRKLRKFFPAPQLMRLPMEDQRMEGGMRRPPLPFGGRHEMKQREHDEKRSAGNS